MSKPTVTVTTLTATAVDGSPFAATHHKHLGRGERAGWQIIVGIDQTQAAALLADCVEAFNRWHAASTAAHEQLDERREAIKDYFRSGKP